MANDHDDCTAAAAVDAGRRRWVAGLGGALLGVTAVAAGTPVAAQGEERSTLLYGFPSGGPATALLDSFVPAMKGRYQPELAAAVRYLPGNASRVAIEALRKAPPDGRQMLMAPSSVLTLLPQLAGGSSDAVLRDLAPVAPLASFTFCLAVGPRVPASVRSLADFQAWLRDNPQQAVLGVPGLNTGAHLLGTAFARRLGTGLQFTAFQGTRPLLADLEAGTIPAGMVIVGAAPEAFAAGRLRGLLVTSEARWPSVPDWPTGRELGLIDTPLVESFGLYVHRDTAPSRIEALAEAVRGALTAAPMRQTVERLAMRLPAPDITPDDFRFALLAESQGWGTLLASGEMQKYR
ncbi:tripartite tricarboxylate transporter substrate-binding protein [Ideonella sp. DXS22W]|uniref:Tripartite tricarboxylate transporter substrate-binding protein n=1 Tax=Pseudaquabacterium inlustre TaxID=2984192 RepID=A0ABU9CFG3_9BURK